LIQAYSLLFSALSLLQTLIQFNEWPKRRHTTLRMAIVTPLFASVAAYRCAAAALLLIFAGKWASLPFGLLIVAQVSRKGRFRF